MQEEIPRRLSCIFGTPADEFIILGYMVISEINQEEYSPLNTIVEQIKSVAKTPESYRRMMLNIENEIEKFHRETIH